jgi:DNA polymerase III delta prime subunit
MDINERLIITRNIEGQLANKDICPICVAGEPGTAKSTTIRLIAEELGMDVVTCSAPTIQHENLSGLPDIVEASEFKSSSIDGTVPKGTQWSIPEIIVQTLRKAQEKSTILLLDDFHMVSPHLQSYFYALLLERRLGNYKLPDNVAIVLTMNSSAEAGFNGINSAVRNRMAILRVTFDFDYWFDNYGNRLHYMVASFLKTHPNYCMEHETTDIVGYGTARAWTAIANELQYHSRDFILKQAQVLAGMQVSNEAARAFQTHVNYITSIDFSKTVSSRAIVNLSKKEPLDTIIYSYIANFVTTVDDGLYLFDLINANMQSTQFIGFLLGELATKYTYKHEVKLTEGLEFVIDRLLENELDKSKYINTPTKVLNEAFNKHIENLDAMMKTASEYLL